MSRSRISNPVTHLTSMHLPVIRWYAGTRRGALTQLADIPSVPPRCAGRAAAAVLAGSLGRWRAHRLSFSMGHRPDI